MVVTKQEVLEESDGCDQLERNVGSVVVGDLVTLQYQGWYYIPNHKTENKRKEFEDMYHLEKKVTFKVGGNKDPSYAYPKAIFPGMDEAVQQMVLGEKARFQVPADAGFGEKEHVGYVAKVPPNSDLLLDVTVKAVTRNDTIHNRKQPKDTSCCIWKALFWLCRAYEY